MNNWGRFYSGGSKRKEKINSKRRKFKPQRCKFNKKRAVKGTLPTKYKDRRGSEPGPHAWELGSRASVPTRLRWCPYIWLAYEVPELGIMKRATHQLIYWKRAYTCYCFLSGGSLKWTRRNKDLGLKLHGWLVNSFWRKRWIWNGTWIETGIIRWSGSNDHRKWPTRYPTS